VDLGGKFPAFRIEARAQKARRDERLPLTPDFAEWLLATFPESERSGPVFKLPSLIDAQPLAAGRIGMLVAKIGKKARVIVARDPDSGVLKYASAHDLRRSFGTRWAKRVMPAVLQRLMRHRSISTTMRYYVGLQADDVAADLWAQHGPGAKDSTKGSPEKPRNAEEAGDASTSETLSSESLSPNKGQVPQVGPGPSTSDYLSGRCDSTIF
jgi:integrase